jgi:HTH-type transcriptional regulator, quorum sensing regulator NprR
LCCVNGGHRIKEYRKMLNISQKEAAGNRLSHSMISLIESGKIGLTTVTAIILADNLNRIAAEKGIQLNLSLKDLLISSEDYYFNLCEKKLAQIKGREFNEIEYDEIYQLASENKLYRIMAKIKEITGDEKADSKDYDIAIECYSQSRKLYDAAYDSYAAVGVLNKMSKCCCNSGDYEKAEEFLEELLKSRDKSPVEDHLGCYELLYELARVKILGSKFAEATEYVDKCLKTENIQAIQLFKAVSLKANLLIQLGSFDEALYTYQRYLNKIEDECNLSEADRVKCYKLVYEAVEKTDIQYKFIEYENRITSILNSPIDEKYKLSYLFLLIRYYIKNGQLSKANTLMNSYEKELWLTSNIN